MSSGVFEIVETTRIDAPIATVWRILIDWEKYPEWNSFVRSQVVTDPSFKKLEDQTPSEGKHILMETHVPPSMDGKGSMKTTTKCQITKVDHENHIAEWTPVTYPSWLLSGHRIQTLKEVEGAVIYETREVFSGPLAYVVKFSMPDKLRKSFVAMAEGLKERAEEETWKGTEAT